MDRLLMPSRAVVLFRDARAGWFLRWLLRPGYQHCTILLDCGNGTWIGLDPLAHWTGAVLLRGDLGDIAGMYRGRFTEAVLVPVREPTPRAAPVRPYTCVESVKRVLGIRARWVWTPFQLRNHLKRLEKDNPMGGLKTLFTGPAKADTSAVKKQEAALKKQEEEAEKRTADEKAAADARMRSIRGGQGAGRSLLVGATEEGVKKKSTLG